MSKSLIDPCHSLTLTVAIENLRGSLGEAIDYLTHDEYRMAMGALLPVEEQIQDVNAAIRLFRRALQMQGGRHEPPLLTNAE